MTLQPGDKVVLVPTKDGQVIAVPTTAPESLANSATVDNSVIRANGTDGKSVQGSLVTINDAGILNAIGMLLGASGLYARDATVDIVLQVASTAKKIYFNAAAWVDYYGNLTALSLITSNAAAHLKIINSEIDAEGTSANINIDINPKGTGKVYAKGIEIKASPTVVAGSVVVSAGGVATIPHNLNSVYHSLSLTYVGSFTAYSIPYAFVTSAGSASDVIQVVNAYNGLAYPYGCTIKWIAVLH